MEEGPEAARWRELVALYRTSTMTHLVYFIGGPRDLSKQVFPGAAPSNDHLCVHEVQAMDWKNSLPPHRLDAPAIDRHTYRLYPAPYSAPLSIFIAIYQGLT